MLLLLCAMTAKASSVVDFEICLEDDALGPFVLTADADETAIEGGAFIDLLRSINGVTSQFHIRLHRAPVKRCYKRVKNNQSQGVVAMFNADGTQPLAFPEHALDPEDDKYLFEVNYCLFSRKNLDFSWTGEKFSGELQKPLLVPEGYAVLDLLNKHDLDYITMSTSAVAINQFIRKKVDAVVTICGIGDAILRARGQADKFNRAELIAYKGYIAVNRQFLNAHFSDVIQFWQELVTQRNSVYPSLVNKYIGILAARRKSSQG